MSLDSNIIELFTLFIFDLFLTWKSLSLALAIYIELSFKIIVI